MVKGHYVIKHCSKAKEQAGASMAVSCTVIGVNTVRSQTFKVLLFAVFNIC